MYALFLLEKVNFLQNQIYKDFMIFVEHYTIKMDIIKYYSLLNSAAF